MSTMCTRYWLRHYKYGLGENRQGLTVLLKMGFMGQKVVCVSSHLQVKVYDCHSTISKSWVGLLFTVQSLSCFWLFATSWSAACQAAPSFTISLSFLKFISNELVMLCNHLILCHLFLLLPSNFPIISLFQWVGSSHQVAKVLELLLQHQSFQWIFRVDFL